ncbi:transcription termination factor NusA [Euhalothece natronophila Z-M001]|uniref:Transcription termination factor NusA n=1 Tax=Euhalothece natronophila Z-M001 TaxID=522448 RepID=A0A5B8NLK7_9CHRO|nr:WXG100 family type VII secretion target [Euhalothece natronophila]QDZ39888.1 transcription termination factor NusA [Euhalothece natronophila Z-M001]
MSRDIDVDEQELEKFLRILEDFQDFIQEQMKSLERKWEKCDDSWQGESKERFSKEFTQTLDDLKTAAKNGDDALEYIEKFYQVVKEMNEQT